jgi:dihydropteroate synthase
MGGSTRLMGILNVTPDSFSEQGRYLDRKAAIARGMEMAREGADIVDIGGESTRPGAEPVTEAEELDRVIPVIEALCRRGLKIPISIDTYKAAVAERALHAGAEIINDVSGLRYDARMAAVAAKYRAAMILMHLRGTPRTMQALRPVKNILEAVRRGLAGSLRRALSAGIGRRRIILDPGIGFGKTEEQNFELVRNLSRIGNLGYPILVGPSRKFFIRQMVEKLAGTGKNQSSELGSVPEAVLFGTAAAATAAILNGAHMLRVHDVRQMLPVALLADRLME